MEAGLEPPHSASQREKGPPAGTLASAGWLGLGEGCYFPPTALRPWFIIKVELFTFLVLMGRNGVRLELGDPGPVCW